MKTLYALIFVCLSSTALADVLDITPIGIEDDYAAAISAPAPQPTENAVDFYIDEYNAESVTNPVAKPTDVAEIQIAARDDDTMTEDNAQTAGVTAPATLKIEEGPVNVDAAFSMDDEAGFDFE